MIYVITEADDRRYVKIGYTRTSNERPNVYAARTRLSQLQVSTWRPLVCIGMAEGDRSHERNLHARLAGYRKTGEWFENVGAVAEWVLSVAVDRFSSTSPVRSHVHRMEHHTMKKNARQRRAYRRAKTVELAAANENTDGRSLDSGGTIYAAARNRVG